MNKNHLIGLYAAALLTFGSGAAMATPVVTVNGVGIPVGSAPGGVYLSSENSFENVVFAPGDELSGVFKVANIVSNATAEQTYTYGQNSAYLHGYFDGFIADTVVAPTATSAGQITFTGGQISYYVSNTDTFTIDQGQTQDFINAALGTLWLQGLPAVIDEDGHTLVITIPANNGLGVFSNATATTFIDVVGGTAQAYFDTNTFSNAFSTTGNNDILFQGTANSGSPNDFPISGTNAIKANIQQIPEPLTLSLFGAGLLGAAAIRRRKAA